MYKIGIVGSGLISEEFIAAIKKNNVLEITALYSRTEIRGREFIDKYKIEKLYTDYDMLLNDQEIDIIYIASPNSLHYEQALSAIAMNKHVIVEKPITLKSSELQDLYDKAEENKVIVMEAIVSIHYNTFDVVKEWIKEIGKVSYAQFHLQKQTRHYQNYRNGEFVNVMSAEMGGGSFRDLGPYCLYPLIYYFGSPKAVSYYKAENIDHIDESCTAICLYSDFVATINTSKMNADYRENIISGENGYILIDSINTFENIKLYDINGNLKNHIKADYKIRMEGQINYFIALLKNNYSVGVNFKNMSLEVCKVIENNYVN